MFEESAENRNSQHCKPALWCVLAIPLLRGKGKRLATSRVKASKFVASQTSLERPHLKTQNHQYYTRLWQIKWEVPSNVVVWYKGYQSEQHPKSGLYFGLPYLNLVLHIEPRTSHMLGKRSTVELFSSPIFLYSVKWSVFVCVNLLYLCEYLDCMLVCVPCTFLRKSGKY